MGADRHLKERRKEKERYVKFTLSIRNSLAWQELSFCERCAWLEICLVYNGSNNGRLGVSSRKLGERLGASSSHAARAIDGLIKWGFLDRVKASSFSQKKLSAEYRLTHFKCDETGQPPSYRYKRIEETLKSHAVSQTAILSPAKETI